jgi:hypothetical protein
MAAPPSPRWDTLLKRARRERKEMHKEREQRKRVREEKAGRLLKDMGYFIENTQSKATYQSLALIEQRGRWEAFVDNMGVTVRARVLTAAGLEAIETNHRDMVRVPAAGRSAIRRPLSTTKRWAAQEYSMSRLVHNQAVAVASPCTAAWSDQLFNFFWAGGVYL